MGQINSTLPVKLFVGILTSGPGLIPEIENCLTARFGPVDLRSGEYPFDLTHYYDEEMGHPITRAFAAFKTLVSPAMLATIKMATNALESEFAKEHRHASRPINLDPGYLEESKIVLASTKNFYHRIFLADGIYGEVTLHYSHHAWNAFPWSFPDFRSGRYDQFFGQMRQTYREQLRSAALLSGDRQE